MPVCPNCRRTVPKSEMVRTDVMRGYNGRRHKGSLLMCDSWSRAVSDNNKIISVIALVVMAVIAIIFIKLEK